MKAWSSVGKCVRVGEGGDKDAGAGVGKGAAVGVDEGIDVVEVVAEGMVEDMGEGVWVRACAWSWSRALSALQGRG